MANLRPPSKVYTGLAEPLLVAGTEPRLMMLNIGVFLFMLITLKAWQWIALTWLIHQALKSMTKNDPFLRNVYLVYQAQADRYEPYPESAPRRSRRPTDFARGVVG